jgi:hypothetical protein
MTASGSICLHSAAALMDSKRVFSNAPSMAMNATSATLLDKQILSGEANAF